MIFDKTLLIINHKSGKQKKENILHRFEEYMQNKQTDHQVLQLTVDPKKAIKDKIMAYGPDVIIAAGGDGTVNMITDIIQNQNIKLLIYPFGSANGMAKDLNMPANFDEALNLLENGRTVKLDLLKINENTSIHLADVGLNARIVKRFQLDNKRGMFTYAKYLFNEVFYIRSKKFIITYGNVERKVKAVSLTFANATMYGTGAVINPEGKMNDGLFEVCIVRPFPKIKLLSIAFHMFTNRLAYSEFFETIQCKQAVVTCAKKTLLQIDGEVIGKVNKIELECLPGAIQTIIPNNLDYPTLVG